MEMVGIIVGGEGVGLAMKREGPFGDSVAVTANRGAKIGMASFIRLQILEAKSDILKLPVSIGDVHLGEKGAIGADFGD
jgi:hypothetical protein